MIITQLLKRLGQWVGQKEEIDGTYMDNWFKNVAQFRQIVFDIIESAVIVAALQAAWEKTNHLLLLAIWLIAFMALTIYLQVLVKWLINAVNETWEITSNKTVFSTVAGLLSGAFSAFSIYVVSSITSTFILTNFMQ